MPPLSITIWHDNQVPTSVDESGFPQSSFMNPAEDQHLDVDFVRVLR
jgi:hypothetical protein